MNDTREYTIWNTPLSVLLRGRLGPAIPKQPRQRFDPLASVKQSTLPDPAKALITKVVKKTRLWKHEKQQIAEELLAHFADGLESGRSFEDLIAKFGDPRKAAKLMRRAKKRNRPLWWRLMRGSAQAIACFVLLYAGLVALFFVGHPSPKVDYTPLINVVSSAAPADQCAWPIYRQAWTASDPVKIDADLFLSDSATGWTPRHVFATGNPEQPAARAFLAENAQLIQAMRTAASKPYLGLIVTSADKYKPQDAKALGVTSDMTSFSFAGGTVRPPEGSLISLLLPHLARLRSMELLLTLDLEDAAARGDSDRVLADYRAVLGMARHTREHPVWTSQIVACAMIASTDRRLSWVSQHHPDALRGHMVELLHDMAAAHDLYSVDASLVRNTLLDTIQHVYTESGSGNGRITAEGLRLFPIFRAVYTRPQESIRLPESPQELAVLIPIATASSSRRDATAYANHYWDLLQQDLAQPAWEQLSKPFASTVYASSLAASAGHDLDHLFVGLMAPRMDHSMRLMIQSRALHEALMAGLALEVYRSHTGHYPAALADLVPQYLPETPLDLSTGQPLLYKLKDGKPFLYGRGLDGKDDGGVWVPEKDNRWPAVPSKGDWVLYPEPAEPNSSTQ